jgi:anti-sigma factor RsiW
MADEDAELVALIDNELDEGAKSRVLGRLAGDEALRARYQALREARAPIAAAFDALIEKAPLARLRAALPPEGARRTAFRPFTGIALRGLAAGIVVGLLAGGAAAWIALSLAPQGEQEDWRSSVVEYTKLYTNETFAQPNPDRQTQAKELSAVGEKVGADFTPENVTLPGLDFKVAFILSFDGSPLGEIAFVDARGEPVLLCVIDNHAPDAQISSERRGELSLASWSRGGRGYLVIGRIPEERAAELARTLEQRI